MSWLKKQIPPPPKGGGAKKSIPPGKGGGRPTKQVPPRKNPLPTGLPVTAGVPRYKAGRTA